MPAERNQLSSVRNAARLLKEFKTQHRQLGVSELARNLGISKSSVHRLVTTLVAEHLLEQDVETGQYRLGLAVYDLAAALSPGFDLHEAVMTPLAELRNRSGETVQVAVLDGREVVYIERLDSPYTVRYFMDLGRRNWANCTSTGKVLLAYLQEGILDDLLDGWVMTARTELSITDPELLRKELKEVKHNGYAYNMGESAIGTCSAAAPIRDRMGRVVGQ